MPDARVVALAESVKDELNAHAFSQEFEAVRTYRPFWKREELSVLRVAVRGVGDERNGAEGSRATYREDIVAEVSVQKAFDSDNDETIVSDSDRLSYLFEEIKDFLSLDPDTDSARVIAISGADSYCWVRCEAVSEDTYWYQAHADDYHVFTAVARLFYRGFVEAA